MKPSFKLSIWIALVATVVGAFAAPKILPLLQAPVATKASLEQPKAGARHTGAPMRVTTFTVRPERFAETVSATGTLLAEEAVELQAEINGKVIAINFYEGSLVKKGEQLVKLNDADLQATLTRAQYRRQLAELRERRLAQLLKQGVARQEEYDIALSELDIQRAEIELTQANIQKTEIRAPFDGVVGLRYVSEGAFVNAATRVATLQRLDKLKVDFSIPEKYAARIRPGSPIGFTISGGERRYTGEIYAFDPRIDTSTRTVLIRAVAPNPDGRLLPGAFARVELVMNQIDNALLIPAVAIIPGLTDQNVFILQAGKAARRAVATGTRLQSTVHILSGLEAGDVVITTGLQQLRPGQTVIDAGGHI